MRQNEEWTVDVVARMHRYRITSIMLAKRCNYTATYISEVLNGKRDFKRPESKEKTKQNIMAALEEIEHEYECQG